MDKISLLKTLEKMLEEASRTNRFGSIEIILQFGKPVVMHETFTTKFNQGNYSGQHSKYETR